MRRTVRCHTIFVKNVRSRRTEVDVHPVYNVIIHRKIMRIDLKKDKEVSEGSHREGRKDRGNREYGNIFYIKMPYCNLEIIHVV